MLVSLTMDFLLHAFVRIKDFQKDRFKSLNFCLNEDFVCIYVYLCLYDFDY